MRRFFTVEISPDGSRVASLEFPSPGPNGVKRLPPQIVIRNLTTGTRKEITCPANVECELSSPAWSPDSRLLAYARNAMATTEADLWTVDADGDHATAVLRGFKGVLEQPLWSPDGKHLAVLATANAHKEIGAVQAGAALVGDISALQLADVQRIAIADGAGGLRYASPADLYVYEYDWMADSRNFVATGAHGNGDDNWWIAKLYRIDAGQLSATAIYSPPTQISAPKVSADGSTVAVISGLMSDFVSVGGDIVTVPVAGGTATNVTPNYAATANGLSWNGRSDQITFTALAGDQSQINRVDLASKRITTLWSAPESITGPGPMRVSLAREGTQSALVRQSFTLPPEIYAGEIGRWKAISSDNDGFPAAVKAQSVTWTNEGFTEQGWLIMPLQITQGKRYPLVVEVHGGPSAASTPEFVSSDVDKQLIDAGYFIFFPNPRGSFGQGERFTAANVKDIGYGDLRDVLAGVDAAEKVAPIDDRRLAVGGYSYGGFMAMWAVTQTHRFKAAFAGAGISNWQSYYGENGIDRWMIPFFGASVYDDPAIYARSSPITFVKNVSTPTLIFVGERDLECPMVQSLEFWHALNALGVPVSLVVYPGEGHRIIRPAHQHDYERRILAWLDRYVTP